MQNQKNKPDPTLLCNKCGFENTDDNLKIYIITIITLLFTGIIYIFYIQNYTNSLPTRLIIIIGIVFLSIFILPSIFRIKENKKKILPLITLIISILFLVWVYTLNIEPNNNLDFIILAFIYVSCAILPMILNALLTVYERQKKTGKTREQI